MQFVGGIGIAIHDDGNCALGGCSADDGGANAFSATGDQNYFVFKLEVQFCPEKFISLIYRSLNLTAN